METAKMKKVFRRAETDLVAQQMGFDKGRVKTVLAQMRAMLEKDAGFPTWVYAICAWLTKLAACDSFEDEKALCELIAPSFAPYALLDVVLVTEEDAEFQRLKMELSFHVFRILKPWLYDDSVEES